MHFGAPQGRRVMALGVRLQERGEGPQYGPHGAKAYSRACLCRGRRTARPSALMHQKRKQTRRSERGYPPCQDAAKQLRRRRGRAVHIDRTGSAEETVSVGGRTFPGLSRHARRVGTMNAEFRGGPAEVFAIARRLGRCQREGQSLQDERIGEHVGEYAPQPGIRDPTHDIRPPIPTARNLITNRR